MDLIISIMPSNLYDQMITLFRKFTCTCSKENLHDAKENNVNSVTLWGDGSPYREFLHVHDLAEAAVFCMKEYDKGEIINIGTGEDIQIKSLSSLVSEIVGYCGKILA